MDTFWHSRYTRRRFMAFGAAGVAPFFAARPGLFAQGPPRVGSVRGGGDPVIDQITREIAKTHTAIKARGLRAEHVHAMGGHARVLLAHARAIDLDARAREGLGAVIDTQGRDTLIGFAWDRASVTSVLRGIGMDASDRPLRPPMTREQKAAALDAMLVGGVTPCLERLNQGLAVAERNADRLLGEVLNGPRAVPAQDCWTAWGILIDEMSAFAEFFAWFAPELSGIFWGCSVMCEIMMYVCCWGG